MFEGQTFEAIMQRMLDRIPDDIDKREGSIIWDALAPESLELSRAYCELDNILNLVFARTTYGEYLDLICESHGVKRKEPEYSVGYAWLEGVPGFINAAPVEISVIVKDTVLKYVVVNEENKTINLEMPQEGKVRVKLLCKTPGVIGNIVANTIELYEYMPGIDKIYNTEAFHSGIDTEDDNSLLQRLLERVKTPPSSGNISDYMRWAKEVKGVHNVKVIPLWNGPGTVKLIIFGENGLPLSQDIINNVKAYIDPLDGTGEGKAPIGAAVTVTTVLIKSISVEITGLVVSDGYQIDSVKSSIVATLKSYFEKILPGETVIFKSVEAVIMGVNGVKDFGNLKINSQSGNINTTDEEKITVGEVTYIEQS